MKKIFFLLFGISLFLHSAYAAKEAITPVELEWEQIPGATVYELEVYTLNKKLLKKYSQNNSTFVIKLPLGQYLARMRVADERNVFGVWSDMSQFLVSLQTPKIKENQPKQLIPDQKTLKAQTSIRWDPTPLATQYRVEIFDEEQKKVLNKIVKSTAVRLTLPPGIYHYQVIATTATGEESPPPAEKLTIAIDRPQLESPIFDEGLDLKWKVQPKAYSEGTLEYLPLMGETWSLIKNLSFQKDQYFQKDSSLKPGQYRLTLWTKAKGWIDSEKVSREFIIKPTEGVLPRGSF